MKVKTEPKRGSPDGPGMAVFALVLALEIAQARPPGESQNAKTARKSTKQRKISKFPDWEENPFRGKKRKY